MFDVVSAQYGKTLFAMQLLKLDDIKVNYETPNGKSALVYSIADNQVPITVALIKAGSRII